MLSFFVAYILRVDILELFFTFLATLCVLSIFVWTCLKDKMNVPILISASLYISFLLELTILSREPGLFSVSDNDFFLTIKMMLENTEESQMYPDIIGNIILFVPCGVFLKILLKRSGWAVLASFFVTLSIEAIQLLTGRGLFEISDLLFNTLGATIGVLIYRLFNATID